MTDETQAPKLSPQAQVIQMLTERLEEAKQGKIESILIGFTTPEGGATVQSSPMGPVTLAHLHFLLMRRTLRAYDRAEQVRNAPASPGVGKVPATGAKDKIVPLNKAAPLARKQRRLLAKATQKAAKKTQNQKSPANGSSVPAALKPS